MPKKRNPKTELEIMRERLESFNADLISLFNQHHMVILFRFDDMKTVEEGYFVESLGRTIVSDVEMIVPILTTTNWDEIIKLDGDDS